MMVLPGLLMSLLSQQFTKVLCLLLCLPSLGCRDRVGLKVSNRILARRVDLFGEHVVNVTLEGRASLGGMTPSCLN